MFGEKLVRALHIEDGRRRQKLNYAFLATTTGRVFKGQAPALDGNSENNTMTRNLLSDNFALTDTVRDFNESKLLPNIVLPTGFVPGKGVEQAKEVPRVVSSNISKKKGRTNSYGWRD